MRKGLVVDLDGSLMNTNTFQKYIVFIIKEAALVCRFDIVITLFYWVTLRKCRCITHEKMKYHILVKTCFFMNSQRLELFVDWLMNDINVSVRNILEAKKEQGYYICLSTAAPENYVRIISERLGLDGFCASSVPVDKEGDWYENVRDMKKNKTLNFLKDRDIKISVLMTDHYDDLPLLCENKDYNYLVNPSLKTLKSCRMAGVSFELLISK